MKSPTCFPAGPFPHWLCAGLVAASLAWGCGSDPAPAADPIVAPYEADEAEDEPTQDIEGETAEADTAEAQAAPTEAADGAPIAGPVRLGEPVEVTVPPIAGPSGQREYLLAIAAAHGVRCDAHAEHDGEGRDAQMALFRDGERIAQNSDAGEGFDARIDFDAQPGTYGVRVWEWLHRDATVTLTCRRNAADPAPEP